MAQGAPSRTGCRCNPMQDVLAGQAMTTAEQTTPDQWTEQILRSRTDEHDAGRNSRSLLEDAAQLGLTLPTHAGHHLWGRNPQKGDLALVGDRMGQNGFAAAWGAMQQHAPRRIDSQPGIHLPACQAPLNVGSSAKWVQDSVVTGLPAYVMLLVL